MGWERTILDVMSEVVQATLFDVRALLREVRRMAVTVAELKASIDALQATVAHLLDEADLTPLKTQVDDLNTQIQAALQPPPPPVAPAESATEPTPAPAIDPATGQPVQPAV